MSVNTTFPGPGGKKLVLNTGAPEVFERWWQALSQAIDRQLEYTQTHLKGTPLRRLTFLLTLPPTLRTYSSIFCVFSVVPSLFESGANSILSSFTPSPKPFSGLYIPTKFNRELISPL